jgi:hypothetical protein
MPWDFDEAHANLAERSAVQQDAERQVREAYKDHAQKERAYRVALAKKITELKADGVAWTSTGDLARGDEKVADLKLQRRIAEGVLEAAKLHAWTVAADRKDVQGLATWSMRREMAELGTG